MKNNCDFQLGIAIGDALGVPVEFKSREYLVQHPVTGMTGNGINLRVPGRMTVPLPFVWQKSWLKVIVWSRLLRILLAGVMTDIGERIMKFSILV